MLPADHDPASRSSAAVTRVAQREDPGGCSRKTHWEGPERHHPGRGKQGPSARCARDDADDDSDSNSSHRASGADPVPGLVLNTEHKAEPWLSPLYPPDSCLGDTKTKLLSINLKFKCNLIFQLVKTSMHSFRNKKKYEKILKGNEGSGTGMFTRV